MSLFSNLRFALSLLAIIFLAASQLEAGFAPPVTAKISPPVGVSNILPVGASYYSDGNGNYLFVYSETSDTFNVKSIQYFVGATSWTAPESVQINGASLSQALSPTGNYAVAVSIGFNTESSSFLSASLKPSGGSWRPLPFFAAVPNNSSNDIAVNSNGNVLLSWSETDEAKNVSVFGAYYNGSEWIKKLLDQFSNPESIEVGKTLVNSESNGNFVISWTTLEDNGVSTFDVASQTFSTPQKLFPRPQSLKPFPPFQYLSVNPNGMGSLTWYTNNEIFVSFLNNNIWSQPKVIPPLAIVADPTLKNRVNKAGQTVLPYIGKQGTIYTVNAVDSSTFETSKIFSSNDVLTKPTSAIDDFGNALVSWITNGREASVSLRNGYQGTWSPPIPLTGISSPFRSFYLDILYAPLIVSNGNAFILYEGKFFIGDPHAVLTNLYLFVGNNLFDSPITFKVKVRKGCCKSFNKLSWTPSIDPLTTIYQIARNGKIIANVKVPKLNYIDRDVKSNRTYIYTLLPLDANGNQTAPIATASTKKCKKLGRKMKKKTISTASAES